MSIENPGEGLNYILVGEPHDEGSAIGMHPVTMTPEASTAQEVAKSDAEKSLGRPVESADFFENFLGGSGSYSETYSILPDGTFDKKVRPDGIAPLLTEQWTESDISTPSDLYQVAAAIQTRHPEYAFDFETDPEGRWFTYKVSKKENGN